MYKYTWKHVAAEIAAFIFGLIIATPLFLSAWYLLGWRDWMMFATSLACVGIAVTPFMITVTNRH